MLGFKQNSSCQNFSLALSGDSVIDTMILKLQKRKGTKLKQQFFVILTLFRS